MVIFNSYLYVYQRAGKKTRNGEIPLTWSNKINDSVESSLKKKQKRYLPSFYLDVDSPTPFEYVEYKDILPQRVPSSDLI